MRILPGNPYPRGATWDGAGTNFALFSEHATRAELCLVVDLVEAAAVERLPEPSFCELLGVRLRCLALDPFAFSAVAKLRLAALREAGVVMGAAWAGDGAG